MHDTSQRVYYCDVMMDSDRWNDFRFRKGDILIASPPKCGTTWLQMICALLVFESADFPRPLHMISPWLDQKTRPIESVLRGLDQQTHRRFIKSHTPLDGLPFDPNVFYLCIGRDPRDIAISWHNHIRNMNFEAVKKVSKRVPAPSRHAFNSGVRVPIHLLSEEEAFWRWVEGVQAPNRTPLTLMGTIRHLAAFWEARELSNVILLHYDDLQSDLRGKMQYLAERLGITVDDNKWEKLVSAATFERMRQRHDLVPDAADHLWRDPERFFNQGKSGQWHRLLNDADLLRYYRRISQLVVSDEFSTWLHRGPII